MAPRKPRERLSTKEQGPPRAELVLAHGQERSLAEARPDLATEAEELASESLSEATHKALRFDWEVWSSWCKAQGFRAMPATPETAAGFLADQGKTKAVATLERYRASIGKLHKTRGFQSPFANENVRAVLKGIRRRYGVDQERVAPALGDLVTVDCGEGAEGARNHAILTLGFMLSVRGDELCSIDVEDLTFDDVGVKVLIRRSKTDQEGVGRTIGVARVPSNPAACPVVALERWLAILGAESGPLFRGMRRGGKPGPRRLTRATVNTIVKEAAERAGLDPAEYGAHSLRAGYVTAAREAGLPWEAIMEQTGHKRIETVRRYDRGTINPYRASKVSVVSEFVLGKDKRDDKR